MNNRIPIYISKYFCRFLEKAYVDNASLSYINCHRLKTRSFFINKRQFNICARCTGIITGLILSPITWFFNLNFVLIFCISLSCLCIDGFSQLFGWRESNNKLRLITGLSCGLFLPYTIAVAIVYLVKLI